MTAHATPHETDVLVVYCTVPTREAGEALAEVLVGERLAACVNLVPGLRSIYRWNGAVQRDDELLAIVKTTRARFEALRARLVEVHPYEVAEVLALPVIAGHAPYLDWVVRETTPGSDTRR